LKHRTVETAAKRPVFNVQASKRLFAPDVGRWISNVATTGFFHKQS